MAMDGSKFKAVNSKERNFSEPKLKQLRTHMNEKIDAYLKA